jgi:hypothetical protein
VLRSFNLMLPKDERYRVKVTFWWVRGADDVSKASSDKVLSQNLAQKKSPRQKSTQ